jgi:hypothetical protein
MSVDDRDKSIIPAEASPLTELRTFQAGLVAFFGARGLPTANVLVNVPERLIVFGNVEHVLEKLDPRRRAESTYVSKFLAAAASGLFDAALNYLWDETIHELRFRVAQYDLRYFYDIAVKDPDRRKKLNDTDDLSKVEDSELIRGANELGLVSDLGFKHLDFIRYMRNHASAAHPNQNEITGLQLIAWLETCITEVINLPQSPVVGQIKLILANVKTSVLSNAEATTIALFFANLDKERIAALASGFFGIYVDPASTSQTRQNIHLLAPRLWLQVEERVRSQFGIRFAQFAASGDQERRDFSRQFLEQVGGNAYIPDDLRAAEIGTVLQDLLTAHRGFNNFYNEPPFARRLASLMKPPAKLPQAIAEDYILGLVEVFLSNGNGIAYAADSIYSELLSQLTASEGLVALLSFRNAAIASRLQFPICQQKFRQLLPMIRKMLAVPAAIDLIDEIERFTGALQQLAADSRIKRKVQNLEKILGLS